MISYNQLIFLKGRLLVDGVVVVNDVIELGRHAKKVCLIFKVDFEKAYDLVSWIFLDYMLIRFDFNVKRPS